MSDALSEAVDTWRIGYDRGECPFVGWWHQRFRLFDRRRAKKIRRVYRRQLGFGRACRRSRTYFLRSPSAILRMALRLSRGRPAD